MNPRVYRALVLLIVAAVVVLAVAWKAQNRAAEGTTAVAATTAASEAVAETPEFPAVLDLGMGKCIPCKEMKPILEALTEEYRGRCRIEIIDVGEHPDQADKYRVQLIPTQIFFDKDGEEVYRHEGFMPREDIIGKLREMGVE